MGLVFLRYIRIHNPLKKNRSILGLFLFIWIIPADAVEILPLFIYFIFFFLTNKQTRKKLQQKKNQKKKEKRNGQAAIEGTLIRTITIATVDPSLAKDPFVSPLPITHPTIHDTLFSPTFLIFLFFFLLSFFFLFFIFSFYLFAFLFVFFFSVKHPDKKEKPTEFAWAYRFKYTGTLNILT